MFEQVPQQLPGVVMQLFSSAWSVLVKTPSLWPVAALVLLIALIGGEESGRTRSPHCR